ncbi:hypothetical protein U5A89_18030 [Sphingobium sp. HWE2-09]|jgi:hypothetical protein|uniref:hypothetical protein n=1 Tax=Sphingobium sp. HWE2-09 TaxID=3108390 RepID=UPI002DCA9A02|nr:hypothetical protein [Sphingobium sp. HWE2-09]
MGQPLGAVCIAQNQVIIPAVEMFIEIAHLDGLAIMQPNDQILAILLERRNGLLT